MVSEEEDLPYLRALCNGLPNVSGMARHVSFICRLTCYIIAPSPPQYTSWQEMKLLPNSILPRLSRSCHTHCIPLGSHLGPITAALFSETYGRKLVYLCSVLAFAAFIVRPG